MWNRKTPGLMLATFVLGATCAAADEQLGSLPPDAEMIKDSLVELLSAGRKAGNVEEIRAAVQPLLFVLSRRHGDAADKVLAELSTYYLGEANSEIYDCIVTRRGAGLLRQIEQLKQNDCIARLHDAGMCIADADRVAMIKDLGDRISKKIKCDLEY